MLFASELLSALSTLLHLRSLATLLIIYAAAYFIYYHYLHPLVKYPGPLLASMTDAWKAYQFSTLHLPEKLIDLHEKYGEEVRVGPNDLSFRDPEALAPIYKAGGRRMTKTTFYDGFTTFLPNLFGTQDEDIHAIRRRQMSHAYSMASIREMETFMDIHLQKLMENLQEFADSGEAFDLKDHFSYYVFDVLGEWAFSRSFDAQVVQDPSRLPPISDHLYLGCLMGMMPSFMPAFKSLAPRLPIRWVQTLFRARKQLADLTAECVSYRLRSKIGDRKDLLTCLLKAVDPETGARLTEMDIRTEAFAMIIAGSHTTSGTLTLLFAHLMQNRQFLAKVVEELDTVLADLDSKIVPGNGLEARLPYTMACLNENFRINPVFTMPLPREVRIADGAVISGHAVPKGTAVFCLNHVLHHDSSIWGSNHDTFDPSRFLGPNGDQLKRYLTPFGVGHRMCIGRNMAMTSMLKVVSTLLRSFDFEAVDPNQNIHVSSVGISEMAGALLCRVRLRHKQQIHE